MPNIVSDPNVRIFTDTYRISLSLPAYKNLAAAGAERKATLRETIEGILNLFEDPVLLENVIDDKDEREGQT